MKNLKYVVLTVACVFLALGFIGVEKSSMTEASVGIEETSTPTPAPRWFAGTKPMPEELKYWVLFKQIQGLKEKDAENQALGDPTTFKKSFYEDRLGLSSSQFASMDTIAADCLAQLQPIEQSARNVINQYRAPYPNGELKRIQPILDPSNPARPGRSIEKLPPVPAELIQLQNQKNQIILNSKESLRQAFGTSAFTAFEAEMSKNADRVLTPLNLRTDRLPPLTPSPTPTPTPGN